MTYTQLTTDWNADPDDPQVELSTNNTSVMLEFYSNNLQFDKFRKGDKARVTFMNCHEYSLNTMNDEGYYQGLYRYKYTELPWGEFYKLNGNWQTGFPARHTILIKAPGTKQNHYIFFFRDNTFESVAERYQIEFLRSE